MISRVADSCFWLYRYMERVENVARLLDVNLLVVLDTKTNEQERWRPVLIVAGEEPRFVQRLGASCADDAQAVQNYMVFDEENPVSIVSSLRWARENARSIRDTISLEMWEALNAFWLWLGESGHKSFVRNPHHFYSEVKEQCALFHGLTHNSVMHNDPFNFMRLGMLLERASQTARVLDVKYHAMGPSHPDKESLEEGIEWIALLRSCSGYESFFKKSGVQFGGPAIAAFLILEPDFPRSVLHCIGRAVNFIQRVRGTTPGPIGARAADLLGALYARLTSTNIRDITSVKAGIHKECTRIVEETARICEAMRLDFFDPPLPEMAKLTKMGSMFQSQG